MIENGMSLSKDDDDSIETTTTALEIHQIQHNVIRTNRYRHITAAPEIRRNSTTSSVSGVSTMIISGRENDATASSTNNFVTPRPILRPIQIKSEPVDPDDEERKEESPTPETSSPSNSSEPASIVTVSSINPDTNPIEKRPSPPMVVINGFFSNDSLATKSSATKRLLSPSRPAPLSVKRGRQKNRENDGKAQEKSKEKPHNLRTIKKKSVAQNLRDKIKIGIKKIAQRESPRKLKKSANQKQEAKRQKVEVKQRGRPKKIPGAPKMTYKKRNNDKMKS